MMMITILTKTIMLLILIIKLIRYIVKIIIAMIITSENNDESAVAAAAAADDDDDDADADGDHDDHDDDHDDIIYCDVNKTNSHGPLTRYVKLWVAYAPGMPGTFSPPPPVSDPGMNRGTSIRHVPWCMSGSLILDGRENIPGIPGACCNFTYLARGPWW